MRESSKPLITPDIAIYNRLVQSRFAGVLREDLARIVGIEVKKLEQTDSGQIVRLSGMGYNSTPPCGTVRVYAAVKPR